MPTVTATESGGFDLHEPDEWHDGTVTGIEESNDGQWGPGLKWLIVLDDDEPHDDGAPWETWAFCSQKLSPRSKLYGWLKGIDPSLIPEPGGTVDLDDLVGTRIQVMFERVNGHDPDGNPQEKEKVTKIRAGKKADKKKAAESKTDDDLEAPF